MTSRLVVAFVALLFLPKVGHGQSSLRNSLSVRPVPGPDFDAYVESVSRDGSRSSVVAELSAVPSGGKARPGEAVLLAMLLREAGQDAEALTVLRQNALRNPTDRMSLSALARAYGDGRYFEEEAATLRQLYELPAPPHVRLVCLRQLAMALQENGRLREMRDAMVKLRKEQPNDAYGWLELAVVQARAGEEEESRRCLYKAAKLRPKDVLLLDEIARREAGFGLYTEALRTLDEADKVSRSTDTKLLRCLIRLSCGEEARALDTLETFTPPADADPELVLALADALMQSHAWGAAARLLDQALVAHDTNYHFHFLRAVALEEMGRRENAATAFISMLTLAAEMPADESPWFGVRHRTALRGLFSSPFSYNASEKGVARPAGTVGLAFTRAARTGAYLYRRTGSSGFACYAYTQVEDAPRDSFILLPHTLLTAKHFAVVHLQRLLPCVAAARRTEAEKALVAGGLEPPEVLLDPAGIQAPGTLARHPRDLALHAARLLYSQYGDSQPLEVLTAEVELFRANFPQLAFIAACRAYHAAEALEAGMPAPAAQPDSAAARRVLALKLADQVPACPPVIDALLGLLPPREEPGSGPVAGAPSAEEGLILTRAVDLALQLPVMSLGARATSTASIVRSAIRRNDLENAIRLLRAMAKTPAPKAAAPPGLPLVAPVDASMPEPLAELGITHPVLTEVANEAGGSNTKRVLAEPALSAVRARLAQVYETDVRHTLQLCLGDFSEIEDELKRRLAQPQPTLADHMLAVWFARMHQGKADVFRHLAAASALTRNAAELRIIDKYVMGSTDQFTGKLSDPLRAFVFASIERLQAVELLPAFSERSDKALTTIGTLADAERLRQRQEQERQARYRNNDWLPNAYDQQQARYNETTQRLIGALKARNLPALPALGRAWTWTGPDGSEYSREELEKLLGGPEALKLLLLAIKPDADSGEATQLSYADTLTKYGERAAALQIYSEMAERDAHAILPRVYAANQLAEDAPDKALAYLRSIRLQSVVRFEYEFSPLALLERENETPAHRAAVARLIARWINSVENVAEMNTLFDPSTCSSLIQMIRPGESEGDSKFPGLGLSRESDDFFLPAGPGIETMKQSRLAHDDLCRALLRSPEAQPTALAALASLVMQDGGDLSECARHAEALLRDPQAWAPLRLWLGADGGSNEAYAGSRSSARPSPMTILARHAAQTKDFTRFETESLPLIEKALGTHAATCARLYARLFSAPEADYPAAAVAWMATRPKDETPVLRGFEEVFNVWQWRALRVDLSETLLKSNVARAQLERGNVSGTLQRYITLLVEAGRQEEAIACVKMLRDELLGADPAERRRLISAMHESRSRYRSNERELNRPSVPEPKSSKLYGYEAWLKSALIDPALVCLLPLAMEEGLLSGPGEFSQMAYDMVSRKMLESPEAVIALAENLGFLADAPGWRNYVLSTDSDAHTWISSLAYRLRDTRGTQPLRQRLAARKPQTLGSEIFAALLAPDHSRLLETGSSPPADERDVLLREVLTRRQAELAAIAPAQRRGFSLLLRKELTGYPDLSKFDASLAAALQPFLDAEAAELGPELDRMLAVKEWAEVGMKVSDFAWRFPPTLAQAARRYPEKVEQVARHMCELLRQTPEDEQQRFFGAINNTPVAHFIQSLGQVPQLLGTCMSLAESEKLQLDPAWTLNLADRLAYYKLMNSRDHVAALFTHSPWVADAAHFNDFVVGRRSDSDGVTLLDTVLNVVKSDGENAQWLRRRLQAEPEQTFGIQLTLALLESTVPDRKTKDNENNARRDPAPLTAFAAAHAKDFHDLSPSAISGLRTIFARYLTAPPLIPDRAR